jgi:two-component system, NarL family, response regulator NreC
MTMLKILLVEDHIIVRQGVKALLAEEPDIVVIGEAGDGSEALLLTERLRPDIVLMDLSMPGLGGIEATYQLRERFPTISVVVLSMYDNEEYVFHVLRAGASGYVLKQSTPTELVLALRTVAAGSTFLSPAISQILVSEYLRHAKTHTDDDEALRVLTPREREVLQLIATGLSNRQIAERLHLSVKTVETHRGNIMHKLDLHDRASLVKFAVDKGLTHFGE